MRPVPTHVLPSAFWPTPQAPEQGHLWSLGLTICRSYHVPGGK